MVNNVPTDPFTKLEVIIIRVTALILLAIAAYKLIRHELGP